MELPLRAALALSMAFLPGAAFAQSAPYRLLITHPTMQALDYPSQARCEAARRALDAENRERQAKAEEDMRKSGGKALIIPTYIIAICIPG